MGRPRDGSVKGTPSVSQASGLLMESLVLFGRLTMPQAGRLACNVMLGDWNELPKSKRKYWMEKAQRLLVNMAGVSPIYSLRWMAQVGSQRHVVSVWYYCGREPKAQLQFDMARPGCEAG